MKGKKSEVLTEGTPGTVVEGGKVISSDAPGNTSFFGGLFGGQSSKPFQNQRALGLADILTLDRFDFDKRGSVFGVSDATGLGGPGDDYKITSSGTYVEKNPNKDKSGTDDGGKYFEENMKLLGRISKLAEEARQKDFMREGIRNIMNAPIIAAEANLRAAQGINDLTIANMGAMAAQNQVLATNPAKQKIAGKYFRL